MICGTCYSAFRVILINIIVSVVNFVINAIAFSTTQWAVSESETGGCTSYLFIGLKEGKSGQSGSCSDDYEVDTIEDCDDVGLDGDECTTFEDAVTLGEAALACAVLLCVFKGLLLWMAWCNNHNRVLWLAMIIAGGADIIFGCLCFASCGYFQTVLEELPSLSGDPELGYGWGLELLSGFIAWITAALAVLVLVKGVGANDEKKPAENEA